MCACVCVCVMSREGECEIIQIENTRIRGVL